MSDIMLKLISQDVDDESDDEEATSRPNKTKKAREPFHAT